jgi:hypothetical protein
VSRTAADEPAATREATKGIRRRLASPAVAVTLGLLTLTLVVLDMPLESAIHTLALANALLLVLVLPFTLVGTVVARRDRHNAVGWLLVVIPLLVMLAVAGSDYAVFVYRFAHRSWPLGQLAVFFDAIGPTGGLLLLPMVILMFPDGRVSGRWRWPLRGAFVVYAAYLASHAALAAVALERRVPVWGGGGVVGANHPSGFASWINVTKPPVVAAFAVLCIASIARQVLSYRGSTGVHRQQLKCLGIGGAMTVASVLAATQASSAPTWVWAFIILGWAAVPLSIGVGILKYRLYEIDRLISRTLSYALLTGLLIGTFIGLVALSTDTLAISGRVGVAASTLIAAALFNPLRKSIQRFVDRRFNRAHYDAEATVAAFTARLRDAVEIDAIRNDLLDAVNRAVQPTHASIWIKKEAANR